MPVSEISDLAYIRDQIPIAEVALKLGLTVRGKMIRCWHPDNHAHGDRTPSVGIWEKRNRVRCFGGCKPQMLSTIDLVMDFRSATFKEAINWITDKFEVPICSRIQTRTRFSPLERRNGEDWPLERFVSSGLWASLGHPAQALLPVFLTVVRTGENDVSLSYRTLQRYSGLGSPSSVRRGLDELKFIGVVAQARIPKREDGLPIRESATYRVTPKSKVVEQMADQVMLQMELEIIDEIELRDQQRADRRRILTQHNNSGRPDKGTR
jgi:hypothetical protein